MGIFDGNDGKPTIEKDSLGLTTGKVGGEYIQNRDRDGRPNGHITKETDTLGLKTGRMGGDYNQHYNKDDERVEYSFDEGHGYTTYVDTTVKAESYSDYGGSKKSSSSSSVYNGGSYGGGYSSESYSTSSDSDSNFSGFIIIAAIAIVVLSFGETLSSQAILIFKIVLIFVSISAVIGLIFFVPWYNKTLREESERQRKHEKWLIDSENERKNRKLKFEQKKIELKEKKIEVLLNELRGAETDVMRRREIKKLLSLLTEE